MLSISSLLGPVKSDTFQHLLHCPESTYVSTLELAYRLS